MTVHKTRSAKGVRAYRSGLAAETAVERFYALAGLPVRDRRWRGEAGEIDLVVQNGEGVVFVEVKKSANFDTALTALSNRQIGRLLSAAAEYLGTLPQGQLTPMRFDLALVDRAGRIDVIENALGH